MIVQSCILIGLLTTSGGGYLMDTKTQDKKTPRPEEQEQDKARGLGYFQSPKDFYEEMSKRPDIREILAKLAKK